MDNFISRTASTIFLFVLMLITGCNFMKDTTGIVYFPMNPTTADPLEYDYVAHHVVFRSTFGSLVTQYKLGDYAGFLAESWETRNNFKEWIFKIREDIKFENGDLITPDIIRLSLQRMAILQKKKKSQSGFLEKVVGFDDIINANDKMKGLVVEEGKIIFKFKVSMPKLLETISFGLYSIVHPNNYDPITGEWNDPKKIISSGAYAVSSWEEDSITLKLRDDFLPQLGHKNKFKKIIVTKDKALKDKADIIPGKSIENFGKLGKQFFGPTNSGISFMRCSSWENPNSICYSKENREFLRELFYSSLNDAGITETRSFFPLEMKGVKEVISSESENKKSLKKENSFFRYIFHPYFAEDSDYYVDIRKAVIEVCKKSDLKYEEINNISFNEVVRKIKTGKVVDFDLLHQMTGILIEDPEADIRFMFQSNEGIKLPDSDGKILEELNKENLDIQKINQLLWDQAIIWPLTHLSLGLWVKDTVDLSIYNTVLPPIDFFWIGIKD